MKAFKSILAILVSLVLFSFAVNAVAVSISPSSPTDDDSLTCNIAGVTSDLRDDYAYSWYKNGESQSAPTTPWVFPASRTSANDYVTCSVYAPLGFFVGLDSVTIASEPEDEPSGDENRAPTVNIVEPDNLEIFYLDTETGTITVDFEASASDPDGDALLPVWNFGDDAGTWFTFEPLHTYNTPGDYLVRVTVYDAGSSDSDTITVRIREDTPNPIAVVDVDDNNCVGQSVRFDGSDSYDPDGGIAFYSWNFGDGEILFDGSVVNHVYDEPGSYITSLTVYDYSLETNTAFVTVDVAAECNEPPVADAGPDLGGDVNEVLLFDGSDSYDTDGTIVSYEWNFGDGTTDSGSVLDHTFTDEGVYTVTLTVTDNDGASDSDTAVITIEDLENPVAVINVPGTEAFLGFGLTFDGSDSYDTDGTIVSYEWNFGDGTTDSGSVLDHTFTDEGVYTVTLTVTDNDGLIGTDTITMEAGHVDRGETINRPGGSVDFYRNLEQRDFSIGRVMPLNYKPYYIKGENVVVLVKLTNEGSFEESLALVLRVPEWNYQSNINNVYLTPSEVNWFTMNVQIPQNAASGLHVASFSVRADDENDMSDNAYWPFIVA